MRDVKVFCPKTGTPPFYEFLASLEPRLQYKLLYQLALLSVTPTLCLKEPHFKHFSLERYSQFYELREKSKILVRIIFVIRDGDILLLAPFIKRQSRDTMKALELSAKMLSSICEDPTLAANLKIPEEVRNMEMS